ncbi:DNA-methyltransferase [Gluconacetobacter entanii]|uniref:Methyltransferase n=1 Tax=Gluconacetobacter entanii TaxID=108528 RepID=A0A318PZ04_9PROT|nr:site-specific DNA-methyltransferase [Gluconacetobacter entanii]PYD60369.1 restriction endonuclease [Gluconacetobacter entanii]
MSEQKIFHESCLTGLEKINDNSVDLIIADPPYNLGKNYNTTNDNLGFDEYISFTKEWMSHAKRIIKPNGTVYIFMGVQFISYIFKIAQKDLSFDLNSWISWHYTQGIGKTKGFSPRHDDILMFNAGKNPKFNLDAIRVPQKYYRSRNNMRGANPGDVWQFSHVHYCNENRRDHPTQKPEGLFERMILASSDNGDVVVDPFSGSGTCARVCKQLNRNCLSFEIDEKYVLQSRERLEEPFIGFDSIDPRMERVPLDLRDPDIRDKYLKNHEEWFLKNHQPSIDKFRRHVKELYGSHIPRKNRKKLNEDNVLETLF